MAVPNAQPTDAAPDMVPDPPVSETVAGEVPVGDTAPQNAAPVSAESGPEEGATPPRDRSSIVADIAKRRREEGARDLIGMTDPALYYGDPARPHAEEGQDTAPDAAAGAESGVTEPATGAAAARPPVAQAPAYDPEMLVPTKVNGRSEMRPLKDVIAGYQKNTAADEKLARAGELLRQAQGTPRQAIPEATPPAPATPPPSAPADAPDLKRILREVQYGDAEDVAPELDRYIDQQVEKRLGDRLRTPEQNLDQVVASKIKLQNDHDAIEKGWNDFLDANPEYRTDNDRAVLLISNVNREMLADLVELTSEDEVNEALRKGKTVPQLHTLMRLNNLGVRHPSDITKQAHEAIAAKFAPRPSGVTPRPGAPSPTPIPRSERKATFAQPQPTPRATPSPAPAHTAARKNPSDIIAQMRAARGQVTA